MRYSVKEELSREHDYIIYLRENPIWYRILTRNPEAIRDFINQYKIDRKKTIGDKVSRVSSLLSMMNVLMD